MSQSSGRIRNLRLPEALRFILKKRAPPGTLSKARA